MNCSHVMVQRHGGLSLEMRTIPKRTQHTTVPPFLFHPESKEKHSILDFLFTQKVRRSTLYWTFFLPRKFGAALYTGLSFTQKVRRSTLYWTFFLPRKFGAALYIGLSFYPESSERHSILDFLFTQKVRRSTLYWTFFSPRK